MTADWRAGLWRARAEQAMDRPPMFRATGQLRVELLTLRAEAAAALADADERLRIAALDRLAAADRIRRTGRALAGTGQVVDPATGEVKQYLRRASVAFDDPLPDGSLEVLSGEDLRLALVDLLELLGRPASVAELGRLLAAHGYTTSGRISRRISNALVVEMGGGRVERVRRGRYRTV
jgi:hypothetical protein